MDVNTDADEVDDYHLLDDIIIQEFSKQLEEKIDGDDDVVVVVGGGGGEIPKNCKMEWCNFWSIDDDEEEEEEEEEGGDFLILLLLVIEVIKYCWI